MAGPNKINWTPRQQEAIETPGSVLVSAAAGSGKTAVLAERCAYFVCDAMPPCDVNRLLVVTFTESAAAEMKSRIRQALLRRSTNHAGDKRLKRQLALVDQAHVSTVHGFCARLLRQHFHLVGLDPAFEILDGDEAVLLRLEMADDFFQRRYDSDDTGDFQSLIDSYGKGDGGDDLLVHQVIAAHSLLQSLANPAAWIDRVQKEWSDAAIKPLQSSVLGQKLLRQISDALDAVLQQCIDATSSLSAMGGPFADYVKQLKELEAAIRHWQNVLNQHGLDMLVGEHADFTSAMPQAPRVRGDAPNKELAKSLLDAVKKAVKEGPLAELLAFTGAQWRQGMVDTKTSATAFLSLVEDFGHEYGKAKKSARAVDFSDLERFTLEVLTNHPTLAESLRDQFDHVLVDEYQDINEIQDAILELLARSEKRANLFVVGDVKQSIFRFRLADPERFTRRKESKKSKVIDLQENFRSRAPLLDAINATFERLMTKSAAEIEYDQSHRLKPGRVYPPAGQLPAFTGAPIELHLLPKGFESEDDDHENPDDAELDRVEYEAILVARQIERLMGRDGSPRMNVTKLDADGKPQLVPIEYSDIVILLRSMRFKAETFADILRAYRIPVHNEGGGGFFEAVEVRDILCLLRILDNQKQDIPLAAILRSPLAGISDDELATIRLRYPAEAEPLAFHEAARRYAAELDDALAQKLRTFQTQLADWRDQSNKRPVAELIWSIYEQSGYLAYCAGLPDGQQRVANLIYLHERAAQFGTFLRQGLHRFLRFIQNLREEKDLGRPSTASGSEQAVRIMTIHRSKGLEFPVVLVPDLGKMHNLSDTKGAILLDREGGLGMDVVDEPRMIRYSSLASVLVRDRLVRQALAEELRLLYVAMTRAREHLILIGTCPDTAIDRWNQQWQNHTGPMPADRFLAGLKALDWLGPTAAMTLSAKSPVFQIIRHDSAQVRQWPRGHQTGDALSADQQTMAALKPLTPPPPISPAAQGVIRRFQTVYPFKKFTARTASASVTSLAKSSNAGPQIKSAAPTERKLDLPAFYIATAPKATDIGTATHLALQHWDFSRGSDENDIACQIESLIAKNQISDAQATMISRPAIQWFLKHDLGQKLATSHKTLMREIAFGLAASPEGSAPGLNEDPMDLVMIRGRIDLLFPDNGGIAIVDYKTDNIKKDGVRQRAEAYAGQIRLYRRAIEKIAGKKITAGYLVFLSAQAVEKIDPAAGD